MLTYPINDSSLPFSEYIALTRAMISERRPDLQRQVSNAHLILDANSPFELYPTTTASSDTHQYKTGALLIHGLLDCPFSLRDIGTTLQENGILCRSILLPGHGTTPIDLTHVSYQDWIQAVRYGIDTLERDVERIFLVGYSTGAALSVYHAIKDPKIAGIIMLAPAIKIKAPVDILIDWHHLIKKLRNNNEWLYTEDEIDYTKYLSITFNGVSQVSRLTALIAEMNNKNPPRCPIFMAISREDETISSHSAVEFFSTLPNPVNKLLLYTSYNHRYPDSRIITRQTNYPNLNIKHFSHVSLPFSMSNPHYGQYGDYIYASHIESSTYIFGAYNPVEVRLLDVLYALGIIKCRRRELTYNPDFEYMANNICEFILNSSERAMLNHSNQSSEQILG